MIFEEKYFSRYIVLILLIAFTNICVVIICFPIDGVINFEIDLRILIKPSTRPKLSRQKFK